MKPDYLELLIKSRKQKPRKQRFRKWNLEKNFFMQSRKWNFKNCSKTYFLQAKWGRGWLTPSPSHPQDTMPEAKIPVKCLELRAGGLRGLILWGFFIPHWRLPYAQNPYSKAIGQLKTFPRERIWRFHIQKKTCKILG